MRSNNDKSLRLLSQLKRTTHRGGKGGKELGQIEEESLLQKDNWSKHAEVRYADQQCGVGTVHSAHSATRTRTHNTQLAAHANPIGFSGSQPDHSRPIAFCS